MDTLAKEKPGPVSRIFLNAIVLMTGRLKSVNKLILENLTWVQELHRRAYEDASTGLWKQRLITDEIAGSLNNPAALIMVKPDRFKILVDSRGHAAGDEAMIKIAIILKDITRDIGHGWPMRFKSNETGLIFNNMGADEAEKIARRLFDAIAAMEPVPAMGENPQFDFSATISWAIWPLDGADWETLFQGNYSSLLETWRENGARIVHYTKTGEK